MVFLLLHWDSLGLDRKSTRLNSSHVAISYAVFCLKKKGKGPIGRVEHYGHQVFEQRLGVTSYIWGCAYIYDWFVSFFQNQPCYMFFFNDTATTEIYTLSLHDALPI